MKHTFRPPGLSTKGFLRNTAMQMAANWEQDSCFIAIPMYNWELFYEQENKLILLFCELINN